MAPKGMQQEKAKKVAVDKTFGMKNVRTTDHTCTNPRILTATHRKKAVLPRNKSQ